MHYPLDGVKAVDYAQFAHMDEEFNGPPGKEHYRLLSYLSMQFNNSTIIDIGTHR